MLLIEVDGFEEAVERQARAIQAFCREHGATDVTIAQTAEESEKLWAGRRQGSVGMMRSCAFWITHDTTVPTSRIPDLVSCVHRLADEHDLKVVIAGHAGDGNIHPMFMFRSGDPDEMARFHHVSEELLRFTVACGGTLSGEHGIGMEKTPFLHLQVDEVGMKTMRAIKKALDPHEILNPGKFV
jgi:glycolate oxidase